MRLDDVIRECILNAVHDNGTISGAAKELGVSRRSLYRLISKYKLDMPDAERWPRWPLPGSPDQKTRARATVATAVSRGLRALPCEVCGSTVKLEAHHEDYSRPMYIHWLCQKHHAELHASRK